MKTTGTMILIMILWDIIRIPIQAYVTKKFMKNDFDEIDQALDTVEEKIDEEEEV